MFQWIKMQKKISQKTISIPYTQFQQLMMIINKDGCPRCGAKSVQITVKLTTATESFTKSLTVSHKKIWGCFLQLYSAKYNVYIILLPTMWRSYFKSLCDVRKTFTNHCKIDHRLSEIKKLSVCNQLDRSHLYLWPVYALNSLYHYTAYVQWMCIELTFIASSWAIFCATEEIWHYIQLRFWDF